MRGGPEWGDYIDLSQQAYIASGLEGAIPGYTYQGVIRRRYELNPWGTFNAKDVPILMLCMEESQWDRIVEFMGHPEWTELDMFANQRTRHQNYDAIIHFYQEFISGVERVRAVPCGSGPTHLPRSGDELRTGRVGQAPARPAMPS